MRAIGRWDLAASALNMSVGGAIFGVPAVIARLLGGASPIAFLIAGAAIAVIGSCLAEVASRFREAGGPYVYARLAFGRFAGLQVGWAYWLVRVAAAAAVANVFVQYLGAVWSGADDAMARVLLLTLLVGALTVVNYCGVTFGARASDLFAIGKLLPLTLFCVVGVFFVRAANLRVRVPAGYGQWTQAVLLLVFAYGGFESAVIPASEFRDPARDPPFALGVALTTAIALHSVVQTVVVGVLPLDAMTDRPLVTAAAVFLGRPGALLMALGALISIYGALSASMLNTPRLTFALAERGDFPAVFAAVHPRFRTPYVSILVYGASTWILAVAGGFAWNANLSAVARLLVYVSICLALLVFRSRAIEDPPFRLRFPRSFSIAGTAFCLWLALRMSVADAAALGIVALLAAATWTAVRRSPDRAYPPCTRE